MTDFEKQVYSDMSSTDRILLYMVKAKELVEFAKIMTEKDAKGLRMALDIMKREEREVAP